MSLLRAVGLLVIAVSVIGCAARRPYFCVPSARGMVSGEFLVEWPRVHAIDAGTRVGFTGEYVPIPDRLRQRLATALPGYRVMIATMWYMNHGRQDLNVLLVIDDKNGHVRAYAPATWHTPLPQSLHGLVESLDWSTGCNEVHRAEAIAKTLAMVDGGTIGDTRIEILADDGDVVCRMEFALMRDHVVERTLVFENRDDGKGSLRVEPGRSAGLAGQQTAQLREEFCSDR